MSKRITVNPNSGRIFAEHTGDLHVTANPADGPNFSRPVGAGQGCLMILLLALAASGTIWAIVKVWASILSTF